MVGRTQGAHASRRRRRARSGWERGGISRRGGNRAGNGALMRCAPIAVRWRDDLAANVRNSAVSAVPTHWDPRLWVVVRAAGPGGRGGPARRDFQPWRPHRASGGGCWGVRWVSLEALRLRRRRKGGGSTAPGESLGDLENDGWDAGYTLLAGTWVWWRAEGFEEGLRAIVEAGGDTDTTGRPAGERGWAREAVAGHPEPARDDGPGPAGQREVHSCERGGPASARERR